MQDSFVGQRSQPFVLEVSGVSALLLYFLTLPGLEGGRTALYPLELFTSPFRHHRLHLGARATAVSIRPGFFFLLFFSFLISLASL